MTDIGTISGGIEIDTRKAFDPITRLYDLLDKFAATSIPKTVDANAKLQSGLDRLAASLDPVIAGEQKLERAHHTLDAALKQNLITQEKYNDLLGKAKEKYESAGQGSSLFSQLIGKLGSVTGEGGELVAKLTEHVAGLGEKLEKLGEGGGSVTGSLTAMVGELSVFIPLLLAAAAAAVVFGAAWAGFDFLKEAVQEGMKTEEVIAQLNNSLIRNGAAAGYSAAELVEQAEALALSTGQSKEAIIAGETMMTRFGKMTRETFPQFREAAINFAITAKTDLVGAFETLARASEDSGRGMMALKAVGIILNTQQKAHMKDLIDNGHVVEYQNELLGLLATKIGGAGEAYANTMSGGIAKAKVIQKEFSEAIASEVIPVLEDLGTQLIKTVGRSDDLKKAWENILEGVKKTGHDIGDFLRTTVAGWVMGWEQMGMAEDTAMLAITNGLASTADGVLDFVTFCLNAWSKLPAIFGGGLAGDALSGLNKFKSDLDASFDVIRGKIVTSLKAEGDAYQSAAHSLMDHKLALEGDTEVQKKHGDVLDGIAKKTKDLKGSLDEADKAQRTYNDHVADMALRAQEAFDKQDALSGALNNGIAAYGLEVEAQKRASAIEAEVTKLTTAHRTEIEKLTDAEAKLNKEHRPDLAQQVADQIDKANREYETQVADLEAVTGKTINLTQANALRLTQLKEEAQFQETLHTAQAQLKDALADVTLGYVHSTSAIKANSLEIAINKAQTAQNAIAGLPFAAAIADRVTKEAKEVDTLRELTAAAKEQLAIDELQLKITQEQASVGDAHLQGLIKLQQDIKAQIASIPKDITDQKVIDDWAAKIRVTLTNAFNWKELFDKAYAPLKQLGDSLASGFSSIVGNYIKTGKLSFQDFENVIVDSFSSSVSKIIENWLTTWFEAMAAWLARWEATQAVAKAVSVSGGGENADSSGGVSNIATSAAWSAWAHSGSTGATGSIWGTAGTAGVTGSGTGAAGLFSGTSSAGALGMVGAWVAALVAFAIVVNKLDAHMQKTEQDAITLGRTLDITIPTSGTGDHISNLIGTGKALAYNITQFFTAYDGIFSSLDESIGIKRRGRGNNTEWKVYADGVVTSFGKDMNAALGYALIEAVKHSSSTGLDPLVVAAIKDYAGKSIDEFKAQVDFAQRLATQNLPGISGQMSQASQQYFSDLHQAQTQFAGDLAALSEAASSVAEKFNTTVQSIKNSALGINTSAADFLAGLAGFQTQMEKTSGQVASQLQKQLDDANAKLSAMGVGPKGGKLGNDSSDSTAIQSAWDKQRADLVNEIKKYTDQLAAVPKALTDAEVNMSIFDTLYKYLQGSGKYAEQAANYARMKVDIEFEAIKLQLIALDKWAEFAGMWTDALAAAENVAITQARQKPGGGGASADSKKSFDQQLKDIAAQGLDPAAKALYDYNKQLADLADQYKHNKVSAADYAAAVAELNKEFKAGLLATAKGYAGTSLDAFSQKLQDGQKFFAGLEAMGRLKSGIPDWLERVMKGEFLDSMKKDWQSRVDAFRGMTNPMDAISANSKTLTDDLHALAVATGMTAKQVADAEAQIKQGAEYQRVNAVNGILDTLFGYLQNDASYAGQAAALKKQELQIQFTLYEYQLKALGAWTDATAKLFKDAQAAALAAADASASASSAATAAASITQPSDDPWALLKSYTDAALDPLTLQLQKINTDFSFIRLYLGNTAQVWQAETTAIQHAFKQAENGLDQFYNSLLNGSASSGTIDEQFHAAQNTYEATLAEIQAGNYTHLGDLNAEAQALIALAGQEYGTSTGGFQGLRADILAELRPILALAGYGGSTTTGGSGITGITTPLLGGLSSVTTAVNNQGIGQIGAVQGLKDASESIAEQQKIQMSQLIAAAQDIAGKVNNLAIALAAQQLSRVQTYG